MAQETKPKEEPTVTFTVKAGHASNPQTLEVHARIRMLPDESDSAAGGGLRITMTEDEES